jgi:hypothetical protein
MAEIGIAVTKETAFRNSVQPFSNVYYYENGVGGAPDSSGALALIDEIVAFEKSIHSNGVTFKYGRCWHQTPLQATTQMIAQKALTGAGAANLSTGFDKERAFLFRWRAGNDSRGNPVYLRKWYHVCGVFGTQYSAIGSDVMDNTNTIPAASRTAMENKVADITTLDSAGGNWTLCSKGGRNHDFPTPNSHPYLEHHQLGDQWRSA